MPEDDSGGLMPSSQPFHFLSEDLMPAVMQDRTPAVGGRASWSGQLQLGPLQLPVKAYPALVVPSNGPLHQIHIACGQRISQRRICPQHGELTSDEIGKAFELTAAESIPLSADEIASLSPKEDSSIHIEHLLPSERVELSLLSGRSLYLAPAQPAVAELYARAVLVLARLRSWAIGRMILSDSRRLVAVGSDGVRLLLFVLHWPEHRRAYPAVDVGVAEVPSAEVRNLEKALMPLLKSFAWEKYSDEGAQQLNRLIADKLSARATNPTKPRRGRVRSQAA